MKIALLYSFEKSIWKSCQTISTNLVATYRHILKENEIVSQNLSTRMSSYEQLELARELVDQNLTHISFVDHMPHPEILIKYLDHYFTEKDIKDRPTLIFHVFGDFTLYGKEWVESDRCLKKFKTKFVCASERQKDLVSKFLKDNTKGIYICPFPVDEKLFFFSEEVRTIQRKKLGLDDDTIAFIYTGRMSLQKKVYELMTDFANFLETTNLPAVLYFAGEFDDLGNPFTGVHTKNGEFALRFQQAHDCLKPYVKRNIKYIGNLSQADLFKHYNASDVFISMSAHNDEDYGMSPAEALCTGLTGILSDWAGYASFNLNNKNACTLIPTKMKGADIVYDSKILLKELFAMMIKAPEIYKNRLELSKMNSSVFAIAGAKNSLEKILQEKENNFSGFTAMMNELAKAFDQPTPPFVEYHKTYNELYKEMYDSYLSK